MRSEILLSFIFNTAMLLAFSMIYSLFPNRKEQLTWRDKLVVGIVMGCVGIGIMASPFRLTSGIQFDTRSILLGTTSLFFGLIPAIISVLFTSVYRIVQGGAGALAGVVQIVATGALGLLWRYFRFDKIRLTKKRRWLELYVFGLAIHLLMMLTILLLPRESVALAYRSISLPVLLILPAGTVLVGLILMKQFDDRRMHYLLQTSQEKLDVTLLSIGDAVIATDKIGQIEFLNKAAEKLSGWKNDEVAGRPIGEVLVMVNEFTHKTVKDPVAEVITSGHTTSIASHTMLVCRNGSVRPIADSAAPIRNHAGDIIGAVLVIRDITREKESQEKLNYLAYHDALTGLYNRSFFNIELSRLDVERNLPLSIIVGDVNGLKLINDAFGHAMGDQLLIQMADRMKEACRKDDIITRWGGDEFMMLLPKTDEAAAKDIMDRIRSSCSEIQIKDVNFSISLGYDTKTDIEQNCMQIIKNAEDEMYRQKSLQSASRSANIIQTIQRTLQEKSQYEKIHAENVSSLCCAIGQAMHLSTKEISQLEMIGRLHDIGKIAIDLQIFEKPGPLNEAEWTEVKRHPEIGFRILNASKHVSHLSQHLLKHHERLDGKGYPAGLSSKEIPLLTRILTVADAYDAMTSDRPYRKALTEQEIMNEFRDHTGTMFDPEVVDALFTKVLIGQSDTAVG